MGLFGKGVQFVGVQAVELFANIDGKAAADEMTGFLADLRFPSEKAAHDAVTMRDLVGDGLQGILKRTVPRDQVNKAVVDIA